MDFYFSEDGRSVCTDTPHTKKHGKNYLYNDKYYMEINQCLQGISSVVTNYKQTKIMSGNRYFYVRNNENGSVFCPAQYPCCDSPDFFRCTHGLNYTDLISEKKGINFKVRVFVPAEMPAEIWKITLENKTESAKNYSLFSVFPFCENGPMGGHCKYVDGIIYKYSYPYHVYYEDKKRVEKIPSYSYIYTDALPSGFETSLSRFFGSENTHTLPEAVLRGSCRGIHNCTDGFIGAFQHDIFLNKGESKSIHIMVSLASSVSEIKETVRTADFEKLWKEAIYKQELQDKLLKIETPDKRLNWMINFWIKKQVTMLTRLNRMDVYCPCRNQLQDALGYSVIDPPQALLFGLKVLRRQQNNGFLKQWYMTDNSPDIKLCLVNHCDAPIWLIICMIEIINANCDLSLYDKTEPYINGGKDTVYCHLLNSALYMKKQYGSHGLVLMLDGDWTDPINGAGRLGRGESVWASEALSYAVGRLAEISLLRGDEKNHRLLCDMKAELNENINKYAFDTDRYICGYSDDGMAFGKNGDKYGELFLNTQTWAIICGAASGSRLKKVLNTIETLNTDFGYLLLSPAFDAWDDIWGRLSIKEPGTTENGSVYCHGTMFKAYADVLSGNNLGAYSAVMHTLPFDDRNLQIPTFVPNFYYGLKNTDFGLSSGNIGTGTAAWLMWVTVRHILGIQPTPDGIRISPTLPPEFGKCNIYINNEKYSY